LIKGGMNRFVWDMRAETIKGIPKVFIEGSYNGRKISPGTYSAKFSFGKQTKTVPVKILADPRINASIAEYEDQENTLKSLENSVNDIHESIAKMRKISKQISEVSSLLTTKTELKTVVDAGNAIVKKIKIWEEKLVQNKAESNDDIINFKNMLSADYIFVRGEVDANVPTVTNGQKKQLAALDAQWNVLKTEMNDLIAKDIAAYNKLCAEKVISKVIIP
jgi:hypothetical protein